MTTSEEFDAVITRLRQRRGMIVVDWVSVWLHCKSEHMDDFFYLLRICHDNRRTPTFALRPLFDWLDLADAISGVTGISPP